MKTPQTPEPGEHTATTSATAGKKPPIAKADVPASMLPNAQVSDKPQLGGATYGKNGNDEG